MIINWPLPDAGDIDTKGSVTVNKLFIIDCLNKAVTTGGWQTFIGPGYVDIAIYDKDINEWLHKQAETFDTAAFYWGIGEELVQVRKLIAAESITGDFILKKIAFKNRRLYELELTKDGVRILHFIKNKKMQISAQVLHEEKQHEPKKITKPQIKYFMNIAIQHHDTLAPESIKAILKKHRIKQVADIDASNLEIMLEDLKNWKPEGTNG